jgi:hypothetical protein
MVVHQWLAAGLPMATFLTAAYALRPGGEFARRTGLIRSAILVAAYATVSVEALSAMGILTSAWFTAVWALALAVALAGGWLRWRVRPAGRPSRSRLGFSEWAMIAVIAAFGASTLLIALVAEPNNYDSMAYHLPKVEQWARSGSVEIHPAAFFAQVAYTSGAEYLLLHLRMLTNGDELFNLAQWAAAGLAAIAVSRIAGQLGAERLGQLGSAVLVWTAPIVLLQATSTQNDLVTAAWCACVATIAIDAAQGRMSGQDVAFLGLAFGLAWSTKALGLLVGGVFVAAWFLTRACRVRSVKDARSLAIAGAVVATAALLLVGPFLLRIDQAFGHPLGPQAVREHAMARHDPAAVVVNTARMLQSAVLVEDETANARMAGLVLDLAGALGVDPQDPLMTRGNYPMTPYPGPNEDAVPFPVHVIAVILAGAACLIWRRRHSQVLAYLLCCSVAAIAIAATVRWQYFGNRFLLPVLVVSIPLVGVAIGLAVQRSHLRRRSVMPAVLALAMLSLAAVEHDVILNGNPRPLYSEVKTSVVGADRWETVFARQPSFRSDYEWAAAKVRERGARRIGLVLGATMYEYPMWLLLPDRELVSLQSMVPTRPAPSPSSVDAVICLSPPLDGCQQLIPLGWQVEERPAAVLAFPPDDEPWATTAAIRTP